MESACSGWRNLRSNARCGRWASGSRCSSACYDALGDAAAIDGVTLRTAKYALNNLVPFVGGLFADTVDTLVGSGMLVQSALGVTGLIVIASRAVLPLCQTLAAAMLYKLASALMQPVSDGSLAGCIHDFAKVLMLLFVLQLSAAAMYLMLIAQLIAVSGFTMMLR
ncbi:MAG: stage III sporulation protein AE [Christensenellales bacterium]